MMFALLSVAREWFSYQNYGMRVGLVSLSLHRPGGHDARIHFDGPYYYS